MPCMQTAPGTWFRGPLSLVARAGFGVPLSWLAALAPLDVRAFRVVLARGWHGLYLLLTVLSREAFRCLLRLENLRCHYSRECAALKAQEEQRGSAGHG